MELPLDCPREEEEGGAGRINIRITRCPEGLETLGQFPGVGLPASSVTVINAISSMGLRWTRNHLQERCCLGRGFSFCLLLLIFQAYVPLTVCTLLRARHNIEIGFLSRLPSANQKGTGCYLSAVQGFSGTHCSEAWVLNRQGPELLRVLFYLEEHRKKKPIKLWLALKEKTGKTDKKKIRRSSL